MKDVLVFLADGFEEVEALSLVDLARRAGLEAKMVSMMDGLEVKGAHGITVKADFVFDENEVRDYRAYAIPGGLPGATNLRDDERVTNCLKEANEEERHIFAICAGPIVLETAGLLKGHVGTSYPGFEDQLSLDRYEEEIFVTDGRIHTSRGPATAMRFGLELVRVLKGEDAAKTLAADLLMDRYGPQEK